MKVHTLRNLLTAMALTCLLPVVNAQFDDVYYDPDNVDLSGSDNGSFYDDSDGAGITYYDDDSYEYYDDYDYYYSSRIRRFHRPYSGFGFYDPCYVGINYYDPFYYDSYYYPGASIYISFGDDYWGYRNWRRWQRWNRWHDHSYWNNWYMTPSFHYYSYNSWCSPSYNYWGGGHHGYHSYSNYYNNYYNSCPSPVSNYYGITHGTITTVNGNTRGSYYGPRLTGNTGSSPRGPVTKPENIQPVMKGTDSGVTQSNDLPRESGDGTKPGSVTRSNPTTQLPGERTNVEPPVAGQDKPNSGVRDIPVDREIKRDEVTPTSKRPVFRPYPSGEKSGAEQDRPASDRPTYRPTEENKPAPRDTYTPRPSNDRGGYAPPRDENKPQYRPAPENNDNRPRYTPPSRNNADDDKPSYKPDREERPNYTPRNNEGRSERPSYTPSQRSNDSGRSNDRPSYSPPSRNDAGSSRSSSPPRESSGSSRSNGSNNSPRGRG